MLTDHLSAVFFSWNYHKYIQILQQRGKTSPTTFNCSSFNYQVSLYQGLRGLFSPRKNHQKNPQLNPPLHRTYIFVEDHLCFECLLIRFFRLFVLQAISHNWCFKPKISQEDSTEVQPAHSRCLFQQWLNPPRSLTVRPWKMMVGKLLSYWEGIFLRGELLNFGRVISGSYSWFTIFNQCLEDHPTFLGIISNPLL